MDCPARAPQAHPSACNGGRDTGYLSKDGAAAHPATGPSGHQVSIIRRALLSAAAVGRGLPRLLLLQGRPCTSDQREFLMPIHKSSKLAWCVGALCLSVGVIGVIG